MRDTAHGAGGASVLDITWYDEVFDPSGVLRAPYASLRRHARWDPLSPTPAVVDQLGDRPLADDTRILPIPLVLEDSEYRSIVQAGVAQRVRALQDLFADLILGPQRILAAGVGLDRDLLDDILTSEDLSAAGLRGLWRGHDRSAIRFVYGPDLVRDRDGRWTVLEDNVGCVGGSADSFAVAERYRTAVGLPGCAACRPPADLGVAVGRWLRRLGHAPGEVRAVLGCEAPCDLHTVQIRENTRRRAILDSVGVPVIDRDRLSQPRLLGGDPAAAVVNFNVDSALSDLFGASEVALFNAPGTGVLGNKALLPFLDDVIRFFTGQEPILATPPTRLLDAGALPADADDWVVKSSTGCQGGDVFVLGAQPRERLTLIEQRIRKHWCGAGGVAQRYVEPSRLTPAGPGHWLGYWVEIRPVAYVLDWHDIHVSEQPLGKAISTQDTRRLNNISQGACYLPVLRGPCGHCTHN
jgi:uncharacterized circularly permuted ATP-grasp superfamily protein